MTTGLTLGKFAPLHRGHQLLIEAALAETNHVIVLAYDAQEVTTCPLPLRCKWIRTLYPSVEVIEAWDGPVEVGNTPDIMTMQEDYILRLLDGRTITHFYSSEFYGDHVSKALGAVDRRIDPDRRLQPISGTSVRRDPYSHRAFLAPEVYRDLVTKVVFLGAPSTGKTTMAESMAKVMNTVWIPEYGREYWDEHQVDRRLTLEQLVEIADGHRIREDAAALEANRYLFVDTDATTTFMFSRYYHGRALPRLEQLAAEALYRYDLFFLCEPDIPYDDTWDRSGEANRAVFHKQIRADLLERRIPFISLQGTTQERIRTVTATLAGFDKFQSLADHLIRC